MADPEQEPLQPGGGGDDQKTNQHVRFDPKGHQHQQQQAQYSAEKPNIATREIDQRTYYINIPIHPLSGQVDPNLDLLSLHPCMSSLQAQGVRLLVPHHLHACMLFSWVLAQAGVLVQLPPFVTCRRVLSVSFLEIPLRTNVKRKIRLSSIRCLPTKEK
jgi:hypothetical protein